MPENKLELMGDEFTIVDKKESDKK